MLTKAFIFLTSLVLAQCYVYEKGPVLKDSRSPCPGLYCGRRPINETHLSECGPCPRGWRVDNNTHSICSQCDENPEFDDWFFLAFHYIFVLVLHWVAIDLSTKRRNFTKQVLALHACACFEVSCAALVTLLVSEPIWTLGLKSCKPRRLSDWYPFFHNPNPNYNETLHCTQEVVFPFYTMIFLFYALCALFMIIIRPFLASRLVPRKGRNSIFAALYFLPALAFIHATCGGLVYMSYPYIVFVLSIISSAGHFAFQLDQSVKALLLGCMLHGRNFVILVGHWLLHAFGILAITQFEHPALHVTLLALVPVPALFYIATARFTDPNNYTSEMAIN